ncbi:MAG TPA: MobA/MobL family protein [Polyangiales bacterium]|nr:MobA/MobL family protein [Polyangiales bacterium]
MTSTPLSVLSLLADPRRSVVAHVAYRARAHLRCERLGTAHDHRARAAVIHTELLAPESAPSWACDRERLWNHAMDAELRPHSVVARELRATLWLAQPAPPRWLREWLQHHIVAQGIVADWSLEEQSTSRCFGFYAVLTTRRFAGEHFGRRELSWRLRATQRMWIRSFEACREKAGVR